MEEKKFYTTMFFEKTIEEEIIQVVIMEDFSVSLETSETFRRKLEDLLDESEASPKKFEERDGEIKFGTYFFIPKDKEENFCNKLDSLLQKFGATK